MNLLPFVLLLIVYYGGLILCVLAFPPHKWDWLVVVFVGSAPWWPWFGWHWRRR